MTGKYGTGAYDFGSIGISQDDQFALTDPVELNCDDIIIGGNLLALEACYCTGFPMFYIDPSPPLPFDDDIGMFEHRGFILGLLGKIPCRDVQQIGLSESGELQLYGKTRHFANVRFKRAHVFNSADIAEIIPVDAMVEEAEEKMVVVIDWFRAKGRKAQLILQKADRVYEDEREDLAKFVRIYDDILHYGKRKRRHVAAVSFMSQNEIDSSQFEFSPQFVQFKLSNMIPNGDNLELKWSGRTKYSFDEEKYENFDRFVFYADLQTTADVRMRFISRESKKFILKFEKLAAHIGSLEIAPEFNRRYNLPKDYSLSNVYSAEKLRGRFIQFCSRWKWAAYFPRECMTEKAADCQEKVEQHVDNLIAAIMEKK